MRPEWRARASPRLTALEGLLSYTVKSRLFDSFWLAGFESACHINKHHQRVDMLAATQHDRFVDEDYARLAEFGIRTARDGIRWHLVDRGGSYDFSSFAPMLAAAERKRVQVIWNLCHYGWPDDLDLFEPAFVDRFARYAAAVVRFMREHTDRVPFFTPVNEISFFSWAAARYMSPFAKGRDNEIKEQLARAAIAGMAAILDIDKRARFLHGEPVINVVPARRRPDLAEAAAGYREAQFDAWDIIAGRKRPELGGEPRYLDIIGCNFYHDNQWQIPSGKKLAWHIRPLDERWIPLHRMLAAVYQRYKRPMLIAETSHIGVGRGKWIKEIAVETCKALSLGVPLEGVCLYPILDRPDWQDPDWWHHSGLWDLRCDRRGVLRRVLSRIYAEGLRRAQAMISEQGC